MALFLVITAGSTDTKDAGKNFLCCRNPESQDLIKKNMPGDAFACFFAVLKKISIFPQLIAYRHIYNEDSLQFQDICAFSATMHQSRRPITSSVFLFF